MKFLVSTIALALLSTTPALAQDNNSPNPFQVIPQKLSEQSPETIDRCLLTLLAQRAFLEKQAEKADSGPIAKAQIENALKTSDLIVNAWMEARKIAAAASDGSAPGKDPLDETAETAKAWFSNAEPGERVEMGNVCQGHFRSAIEALETE